MTTPDYRTDWFVDSITDHRAVRGARALSLAVAEVTRKKHDPITVSPVGNRLVDTRLTRAILDAASPMIIVVVSPAMQHYEWPAREYAMDHGSSIMTMSELYTFMDEPDPRPFLDKNVSYNLGRLEQHTRVRSVQMLCERSMLLLRDGALSDLVVSVEYEYEFTEEGLVSALARHPESDIILNANPNGHTTVAAKEYARAVEVPVFRISELMGALNFDGSQMRDYHPPKRSW